MSKTKDKSKEFFDRQSWVGIDTIKPYSRNNKIHPQDQINLLVDLIDKIWFTMPLLIDKDGVIVSWHWRYLAAKQLGLEEIPVIKIDDISDEMLKEYRIFDNRISDLATYNLENLKIELDSIGSESLSDLFSDFSLDTLDTTERKEDWKTQSDKNFDFRNNPVKTIALFFSWEEYIDIMSRVEVLNKHYWEDNISDLAYKIFVDENNWA